MFIIFCLFHLGVENCDRWHQPNHHEFLSTTIIVTIDLCTIIIQKNRSNDKHCPTNILFIIWNTILGFFLGFRFAKISFFFCTHFFLLRMFEGLRLTAFFLLLANVNAWRPCPELSPALRFPCRCKVEPFGPKLQLGAVAMDCDYVVFQTEGPTIPTGAPIITYSQRYSGQQVLPTQV